MPVNPPAVETRAQKVTKTATRFANRHSEAVILLVGILVGALIRGL